MGASGLGAAKTLRWSRSVVRGRSVLALAVILLLAVPLCHARAQEQSDRAAQARALIASPDGAALLNLLGDPAVREQLLAASPTPRPPIAMTTIGGTLDRALGSIRARIIGLGNETRELPADLATCWAQLRANVPDKDLRYLLLYLAAFILGGVGAQRLFLRLSRPWREHFARASESTLRQRVLLLLDRLLFAVLLLGSFAAGSLGTFMLFTWPPSTGWIILGYLSAAVLVRFSLMSTRVFLAPAAEHLRLVPMSTASAWFWHRWLAGLTAVVAYGWQALLMLRSLGMPRDGVDLLRQFIMLVVVFGAVAIVWLRPDQTLAKDRPRRTTLRVLSSLGLLAFALLILMGASEIAWSVIVLGCVPVALHIFRHGASRVIHGPMLEMGEEVSAIGAITVRCLQALVFIVAAYAMVDIWHIDLASVAASETAMTRVGRGAFEALVILVGADLLWQVVRILIDQRLTGTDAPVDYRDDADVRRRARIRTLLPVLRNLVFFFVLIMASLSALAAMGLQIGPLLAGAGVVGIAVGFGAQTLVRDILSGIFFLFDDAFRVGEFIESGSISGTVESFSLRSIKLRHYRGHLHTVPFGDLKQITNYSRDWVKEPIQIVVTYETDLDRVESAIERVSAELADDLSMADSIIDPLVSLGVTAMVDTGIQVGLIVKTRPGRQYDVRSAVFRRLKTAFADYDIRFASQSPVLPGAHSTTR